MNKKPVKPLKIIALLLFLSVILSALYILFNSNHECTVENCCICLKLEAAANILKLLSAGILISLDKKAAGADSGEGRRPPPGGFSSCATPTGLKVRMNN